MKKLIIAIGLLAFIAASNILSWAENKPIYVCRLEKNQQVQRYVDNPAKCKSSEIAMALAPVSGQKTPDPKSSHDLKESLGIAPSMTTDTAFGEGGA